MLPQGRLARDTTEYEVNSRELAVGGSMNEAEPSIFDLSPSEKLQLVEDLWDDLAGEAGGCAGL